MTGQREEKRLRIAFGANQDDDEDDYYIETTWTTDRADASWKINDSQAARGREREREICLKEALQWNHKNRSSATLKRPLKQRSLNGGPREQRRAHLSTGCRSLGASNKSKAKRRLLFLLCCLFCCFRLQTRSARQAPASIRAVDCLRPSDKRPLEERRLLDFLAWIFALSPSKRRPETSRSIEPLGQS